MQVVSSLDPCSRMRVTAKGFSRHLRKNFPDAEINISKDAPDPDPTSFRPGGSRPGVPRYGGRLHRFQGRPIPSGDIFVDGQLPAIFLEEKMDGSGPPGPSVIKDPPFSNWLDVIKGN